MLIAFLWRPLTGGLAAVLIWVVADVGLSVVLSRDFLERHAFPAEILGYSLRLIKGSATLLAIALFTAVVNGSKSRTWFVSLVYGLGMGALALSSLFVRLPFLPWILLLAVALPGLFRPEMRRPLLVVITSVFASYLPSSVWGQLLQHLAPYGISQTVFLTGGIASTISTPLLAVAACSLLEKRVGMNSAETLQ